MKRLMIMAIVGSLLVGATPAHANHEHPQDHPIVFACKGTSGYDADGQYQFRSDRIESGQVGVSTCLVYAPDSLNPNPPPPPSSWLAFLFWAGSSQPLGHGYGRLLDGVGDFACGNGSLADPHDELTWTGRFGTIAGGVRTAWTVTDWSATFSNGVGEIEGQAEGGGFHYEHPNSLQQRTLSGSIFIDDGAATGNCDDSAGNSTWYGWFVFE